MIFLASVRGRILNVFAMNSEQKQFLSLPMNRLETAFYINLPIVFLYLLFWNDSEIFFQIKAGGGKY